MTTPKAIWQKAYRLVRDAILRGDLVRPDACSKCNQVPRRARDGRSSIHAHHQDHSKPLDVEWICVTCHREETPKPEGHANLSRLTPEIVREIRTSQETNVALGLRYGVDPKTVHRARRHELWKHVQ